MLSVRSAVAGPWQRSFGTWLNGRLLAQKSQYAVEKEVNDVGCGVQGQCCDDGALSGIKRLIAFLALSNDARLLAAWLEARLITSATRKGPSFFMARAQASIDKKSKLLLIVGVRVTYR